MTHANPVMSPSRAPMDSLGCAFDRLAVSQQFTANDLRFYRKRSDHAVFGQVQTPAADRGFLVGVSLQGGHRRRITRGSATTTHDFDAHGVYIRDFTDDYHAELSGTFDFVLVELPGTKLAELGFDAQRAPIDGLTCRTAQNDDVLGHLVRAMLPAFARPGEVNRLFVDQLGVALGTHLVQKYGGADTPSLRRRQTLSGWQQARAKELLMSSASAEVSIAAIAAQCRLSASHFIRAFRDTTGSTPYQWQLAQRIERARTLLASSGLSLVDVASACGFTDQSHFTRVFSRAVGVAPGNWRRRQGEGGLAADLGMGETLSAISRKKSQ